MCVGFLPLSCAVPVSGYSCLPFSDIGQGIVARAIAKGRETWISSVVSVRFRSGSLFFFSVGLRPQKATH